MQPDPRCPLSPDDCAALTATISECMRITGDIEKCKALGMDMSAQENLVGSVQHFCTNCKQQFFPHSP